MKSTVIFALLFVVSLRIMAQPHPGEDAWDQFSRFFSNITGTWKNADNQEFESWELRNGKFTGKAWKENGNETKITEYLKVYENDGNIYYQATVPGQNQGQPVDFSLISCSGDKAAFSNPEHDFPQMITYELLNENELSVTISGMQNDKNISVDFDFFRVD